MSMENLFRTLKAESPSATETTSQPRRSGTDKTQASGARSANASKWPLLDALLSSPLSSASPLQADALERRRAAVQSGTTPSNPVRRRSVGSMAGRLAAGIERLRPDLVAAAMVPAPTNALAKSMLFPQAGSAAAPVVATTSGATVNLPSPEPAVPNEELTLFGRLQKARQAGATTAESPAGSVSSAAGLSTPGHLPAPSAATRSTATRSATPPPQSSLPLAALQQQTPAKAATAIAQPGTATPAPAIEQSVAAPVDAQTEAIHIGPVEAIPSSLRLTGAPSGIKFPRKDALPGVLKAAREAATAPAQRLSIAERAAELAAKTSIGNRVASSRTANPITPAEMTLSQPAQQAPESIRTSAQAAAPVATPAMLKPQSPSSTASPLSTPAMASGHAPVVASLPEEPTLGGVFSRLTGADDSARTKRAPLRRGGTTLRNKSAR